METSLAGHGQPSTDLAGALADSRPWPPGPDLPLLQALESNVSQSSLYLQSLRRALDGCDPAVLQDALCEAESQMRRELQRLSWAEPLLPEAEAMARTLAHLGTPEARAELYRQREQVLAETLGPELRGAELCRPWPSFFGVVQDSRAYTALLYLLMAMPTGIFYFVWCATGLSLSLGLLILVIGLPLLALFLGSVRALGLGEGRLVEALLDVRMPRRQPLLPEGHSWGNRLLNLFRDGYTWKCLAYLVLHLPLGMFYFVIAITGIAVPLSLIVTPILHWGFHVPLVQINDFSYEPSGFAVLLFPLLGILGLVGTLHLALLLGRFQGWMAKSMLVTHRRGEMG